jgi:hypothetical protein
MFSSEFFKTFGEERATNVGNEFVVELLEDKDVRTVIGGLVVSAALTRLTTIPHPACIAIGLGLSAYQLYKLRK